MHGEGGADNGAPTRSVLSGQGLVGRVLAARRLGLSEIPTIVLDHLSEAERRALGGANKRVG